MTGQAPNPMSPCEPLRPPQRAIARPAPAAAPASAGAWLGRALVRLLSRRRHVHGVSLPTDPAHLATCLRPGDVLLVEGDSRFSVGTQYLTQSTWSHAALYVGAALGDPTRAICSTLVAEAFGRTRCARAAWTSSCTSVITACSCRVTSMFRRTSRSSSPRSRRGSTRAASAGPRRRARRPRHETTRRTAIGGPPRDGVPATHAARGCRRRRVSSATTTAAPTTATTSCGG